MEDFIYRIIKNNEEWGWSKGGMISSTCGSINMTYAGMDGGLYVWDAPVGAFVEMGYLELVQEVKTFKLIEVVKEKQEEIIKLIQDYKEDEKTN